MAQPRSAVFTRPAPPPARIVFQPPNLLVTTLGTASPFTQTDWPNPKPARVDVRGYSQSFPLSLVGQDQFFGAAGQVPCHVLPNPKPPRYDIRGYSFSFPLTLVGKDQFFGDPGQVPTHVLPNPKPGRVDIRGYAWSFPLSLIGQDQFFGDPGMGPCYDWPNPKPPRVDIRGYTSSFPLSLIGQDQFFGAPGMGPHYDWPLPIKRTPPQNLHVDQQPLALVVTPGTPFFVSSLDMPVVKRAQVASLQTTPQPLTLVSVRPFFVSAIELPVRPAARPIPAQIVNILPLRSLGFTQLLIPKVRTTDPALRRHCDLVSDILNSLIRQGILRLEDLGEWELDV